MRFPLYSIGVFLALFKCDCQFVVSNPAVIREKFLGLEGQQKLKFSHADDRYELALVVFAPYRNPMGVIEEDGPRDACCPHRAARRINPNVSNRRCMKIQCWVMVSRQISVRNDEDGQRRQENQNYPPPKSEAPPESKGAPGVEPSKAEGGETAAGSPSSYSRGEGQKPVSKAYKENWNVIFAKKKRR